jgi:TolA-binding protein
MRSLLVRAPLRRVLSLAILVSITGCAYYNTFYLAKRFYREGERAQAKSELDVASADAAGKYDAAIRQCTKLVTDYPKSKWVDDAMYLMGASLYGRGEYAASIRKLDELIEKFPKSPFLPEARFTKGLAHLRLREYEVADSLFRGIDHDVPGFSRKWALYYYAGESQAQQKNYAAALDWYRRAVPVTDDKRERGDALRRAGDALYASARFDTARVVYLECLRVEERGRKRLDVAFQVGKSLQEMKRYEEALRWFNDWRAFAAAEKREGELNLRVYDCMGAVGRWQDAISGYRRLVEQYPRTPIAYEAQFQIGYLYESKVGDLNAAGQEYDKLRNEAASQFQIQALRRSQSLATLKRYRQELVSDTTQAKARAAFMLAELYYFQLDKADSAEEQYRLVERDFPKSRYAPKAAYARLWILMQDRGDTLGAAALLDSIVDRYRGTRAAESSLYLWKRWSGRTDERTALLDSLLANPDLSGQGERFEDEPPLGRALPDSAGAARADSAWISSARADSLRAESLRAAGKRAEPDSAGSRPGPGPGARPDSLVAPRVPRAATLPDTAGLPTVGPTR